IRADRQDLQRDYAAQRAGKNVQADIARDKADLRADYQDVNRDRADIRADRRDLHADGRDLRADHGDLRHGERLGRHPGPAFNRGGVTADRLGTATSPRLADSRQARTVAQAADARKGLTPTMLANNAAAEAKKPPTTKATHKAWYHWWW